MLNRFAQRSCQPVGGLTSRTPPISKITASIGTRALSRRAGEHRRPAPGNLARPGDMRAKLQV